jgi:hypothetical protein
MRQLAITQARSDNFHLDTCPDPLAALDCLAHLGPQVGDVIEELPGTRSARIGVIVQVLGDGKFIAQFWFKRRTVLAIGHCLSCRFIARNPQPQWVKKQDAVQLSLPLG